MFKQPCTVKLAGVSFGNAQSNIKTFGSPDIRWFALVREPDKSARFKCHPRGALRRVLHGLHPEDRGC
jgi:hypothetical protein